MKKIKKFLVIASCVLLLSGCKGATYADTIKKEKNMPNLVETSYGNGYYYVIDKNTGVIYLRYSAGHQGAITVMLNTDGTPVTAEQLGLEY